MTFVPAAGCARVIFAMQSGDSRAYNFLWFKTNLTWTQYDPFLDMTYQEYLNFILESWWTAVIAPLQHTSIELLYIRSRVEATETGSEIQRNTSVTGEVASIAPSNAALVCTLKTGHAGRSYRGRFFLAGIPASALAASDPNNVSSSYLADYLAAMEALATAISPSYHHVVVSHFTDGAERATAVVTQITEYSANARLDSQRRRTRLASV